MYDEPPAIHLTHDEYEKSKDMPLDLDHKKFGVSATQYQEISDTLQAKFQRKYELRPRPGKNTETPTTFTKKIPAKKTADKPIINEKTDKHTEKPTEKFADKFLKRGSCNRI